MQGLLFKIHNKEHCHSGASVFVQGFVLVADDASYSDPAKPSSCMMEHYINKNDEIKVHNNTSISWGHTHLNLFH